MNDFVIDKFNQYGLPEGKKYSICPLCSASRKKSNEKCMMLDWERGLGTCQHCGEVIQLHTYKKRKTQKDYIKPEWRNKTELPDKIVKFFEDRKISQVTLKNMRVTSGVDWMPQFQKEVLTIHFNYFINGELINIKYRGAQKSFKMHKGAELVFYNLDGIFGQDEAYIVEGEMDALSLVEAGIRNVVSVPNGATTNHVNLEYLDNTFDFFNDKKIILVLDRDEPGMNLEAELKRRFGTERCYRVDLEGFKDANEYLMARGAYSLEQVMRNYEPYPISDVITIEEDGDDLKDFLLHGMPPGKGIGLKTIDDVFTIETGRFLVVTGIPTYGKSTVIDHFVTAWNTRYGWKAAYASPENFPVYLHKERVLTKLIGFKANTADLIASKSFSDGLKYVDENFFFISFRNGGFDLKRTLAKAKELIERKGIKVLVLDPFNKIRLKESIDKKVNDYTNDYLNELETFARVNDILIVLVAHPTKMTKDPNGKREMPDFYDVKGGGEFYDMSPFGLVVHRNFEEETILIKILKVKFAHMGKNGETIKLKYNINNGRIAEFDPLTGNAYWDNSNWIKENKEDMPFESEGETAPF